MLLLLPPLTSCHHHCRCCFRYTQFTVAIPFNRIFAAFFLFVGKTVCLYWIHIHYIRISFAKCQHRWLDFSTSCCGWAGRATRIDFHIYWKRCGFFFPAKNFFRWTKRKISQTFMYNRTECEGNGLAGATTIEIERATIPKMEWVKFFDKFVCA